MECVVVGAGTPFLPEVIAILDRLSWPIIGYVEGGDEGVAYPDDIEPVPPAEMPAAWSSLAAVIPILSPWQRREVVALARGLGFTSFPPLVDPMAVAPHRGELGEGCILNAGVVIGARTRVGAFTAFNRAASIGHDADIGDFCFFGPGATACGRVSVGAGTIVGAGSLVLPGSLIGPGSFVAAGSLVSKPVPAAAFVSGRPARVTKTGLTERDVSL